MAGRPAGGADSERLREYGARRRGGKLRRKRGEYPRRERDGATPGQGRARQSDDRCGAAGVDLARGQACTVGDDDLGITRPGGDDGGADGPGAHGPREPAPDSHGAKATARFCGSFHVFSWQ